MKKFLFSTALGLTLATASAADVAQNTRLKAPVLRADMITSSRNAQSSSSGSVVILLLFLAVVAAAASAGGSDGLSDALISDQNLKTDIRKVGVSPSGIGIYEYRYKGHPQVFRGAIAQDVQRHVPGAVTRGEAGYLMVNYSQIDVPLRQIR
ncbi:tail fiber domain-containing protein [Thalassococcus sp. BH17M4-6]|uniref:tail fiber domain-containing protein n=1 Tax=Thalassococcus sp. BH17M4-6 TaxID=3413148 RepID=UPI003BBB6B56